MSIIYINSNIVLLRVRNHKSIIYNKVLDKIARLAHDPYTYKIPWYDLLVDIINERVNIMFLTQENNNFVIKISILKYYL